jgi:hypothetical protein
MRGVCPVIGYNGELPFANCGCITRYGLLAVNGGCSVRGKYSRRAFYGCFMPLWHGELEPGGGLTHIGDFYDEYHYAPNA